MKNNLTTILGLGIISIAASMLSVIAYLAFVPVKVIAPQTQPYKIITKTVKIGEPVIYQVDVCKYREAPATIIRRFVDEDNTSYPLPTQLGNVTKGCQKSNIPVITPVLHPGKWHLILDVSYKVNAFRTENYHLVTENFTITNKE